MGILEVGGFLCVVGVTGRRRFFFADTVPEGAGVTSIAFRFRVVPLMILLNMFSNGFRPFPHPLRRVLERLQRGSGPDEYVWSICFVLEPTV